MSKLQYAIIWNDENALVSQFYASPEEAIDQYVKDTGMPWEEQKDDYHVQGFTPEEILESESWPEI